MNEELKIVASLSFTKGNVQINADAALPFGRALKMFINGVGAIKKEIAVDTDPKLIDFGEVEPVGYIFLRNLGDSLIKTPNDPIISVEGLTGAGTWGYKIVANQSEDVNTIASQQGTTTTGNAILSTSNFNFIQWKPVGGAVSYDVYRSASGGTPSLLGWFTKVEATNTFIDEDGLTYVWTTDTGVAGDGIAPPDFSPFDFTIVAGPIELGTYPIKLQGGQIAVMPWNVSAMYVRALFNPTWVEQTVIPE